MKKAMKQSTQALILSGVSVLILLFMITASIFASLAGNAANRASSDRFELTYNANRFMNGSSYLTNEVRAYAATGEIARYDNYWNEVNNLKNRDIGVERMEAIGLTEEEEGYIRQMSELSNALVPLEEAAMNDVAAGRMDKALGYVYGDEYCGAVAQINALKETFLEKLDHRALAEVEHQQSVSRTLQILVYVAVALVVVLQVYTNYVIRAKLLRPIIAIERDMLLVSRGELHSDFALEPDTSEIGMLIDSVKKTKGLLQTVITDINTVLTNMAKGDMNQEIRAEYLNDFAPMKTAVNQILDSLNGALAQIMRSADQVAGSAVQVSEGANTLSQGATEQAGAVEELTATINRISGQIEQIAANAASARSCSLEASGHLRDGNEKMQELTGAMEEISKASARIGGIIKAIEDIAFQTNILALNAAVEASRAGVAGKGFAVVADEVRSLADKSSQAAKDSAGLIEETIRMVSSGSALTEETARILERVVGGAKASTEYVEQIAAATDRQAEALHGVTSGLGQISSVVQNNAAAAEESAASAEDLTRQAATQRALVGRFHLRAE